MDTARAYCEQHHIAVKIAFDRTCQEEGFFDRAHGQIVLGAAIFALADWAGYYLLLRVLVLAHQTMRPQDFDALTARSKDYRVEANGTCAKWMKSKWQCLDLNRTYPQSEAFWHTASIGMPHLLSANEIAIEETRDLLTHDCARDNLNNLHYMATPKNVPSRQQFLALFDEIDRSITNSTDE